MLARSKHIYGSRTPGCPVVRRFNKIANKPHKPNVQVKASSAASSQVENARHITSDGWGLELLLSKGKAPEGSNTQRPPLLFIHGSYHAAWCWAENFLPYFADRGYDAYAVSLRAQGGSDCMSRDTDAPIQVANTLDGHSADLADLIEATFPDSPPVVISHSFGSLILQKYVLKMASAQGARDGYPRLSGVGYLSCVPPSGNRDLIIRFLRKDLWLSLKVTWGFVAKSFATSLSACRELFFSDDIPQEALQRYQKQLAACSPVRLMDLSDVNKQVPLATPPLTSPPAFVLGGEDDKVVDVEAIHELAKAYRVKPVILPRVAHDCMLDTRWELVAAELEKWLSTL